MGRRRADFAYSRAAGRLTWDELAARQKRMARWLEPMQTVLATWSMPQAAPKPDTTLQVSLSNLQHVPVEVLGFDVGKGTFLPPDPAWIQDSAGVTVTTTTGALVLRAADDGRLHTLRLNVPYNLVFTAGRAWDEPVEMRVSDSPVGADPPAERTDATGTRRIERGKALRDQAGVPDGVVAPGADARERCTPKRSAWPTRPGASTAFTLTRWTWKVCWIISTARASATSCAVAGMGRVGSWSTATWSSNPSAAAWALRRLCPIQASFDPRRETTWDDALAFLRQQADDRFRVWLSQVSCATILNHYEREYYVSWDGQIRLTLDTRLTVYDQRFSRRPNLRYPTPLPDTMVIELKADTALVDRLSDVLNTLPFRPERNSKYVNGFLVTSEFLLG